MVSFFIKKEVVGFVKVRRKLQSKIIMWQISGNLLQYVKKLVSDKLQIKWVKNYKLPPTTLQVTI